MAPPTQLKGSFRGVSFGTFAHSMEGGRRTVTHEFPGRDNPYTEDLGLKARTFSLDLFVLGGEVSVPRDRLRAALDLKGPGTLVHPYLGTLRVQVSSYTVSESYDAQRLARFSVGFVQPGELQFPSAATNPGGAVSATSTAASLQAGFNALGIDVSSAAASAAMGSLVGSTAQLLQTSVKRAAQPNSLPAASDTVTAIQLMSSYVSDSSALAGMVATPDVLTYALADVVFRVSSLGMTPLQAFVAYQRLLADSQLLLAGQNFPSTAIGATMAGNASLFADALYTAIVGSAAVNAVDATFTTYDQAIATREALGEMFDMAMGQVTESVLFGYLQDLRGQSLVAIPSPDQALPNVVSVRASAPLPSLVLAYDLMGGSVDEQTVIDLNAVRNPWFAPNVSGAAILVLR